MGELKKTPLYDEHVKLGAKIVEFSGWSMPVFYSNVIEEHLNTREKAGLFDICHMGEFFIEGNGAFALIQMLITNDLNRLEDGKAFYTHMCRDDGGIIDDVFVYRFDKNKFMVVVNAANVEKDFNWFLRNKDFFDDAGVIDKTSELAKLDLQGPKSEDILQKLTHADLRSLKRFSFIEEEVNGVQTIISRTGYTAEDGFELYFDSGKAVEIWNRLLDVGREFGLKPVGLGARNTLRVEACYSLYGHELSEDINPFEVCVGFVVKLDKVDFIGKAALEKIKERGLSRKIVAFEMLDKGIPRQDYEACKNNGIIGYVTSGTMSPTYKKGIGMAFVKKEEALEENEINIKIREKLYPAKIVKRPFYKFKGKI